MSTSGIHPMFNLKRKEHDKSQCFRFRSVLSRSNATARRSSSPLKSGNLPLRGLKPLEGFYLSGRSLSFSGITQTKRGVAATAKYCSNETGIIRTGSISLSIRTERLPGAADCNWPPTSRKQRVACPTGWSTLKTGYEAARYNRQVPHPPTKTQGMLLDRNTALCHTAAGTWSAPLRGNLAIAERGNGPSQAPRNGAPSCPTEQKENDCLLNAAEKYGQRTYSNGHASVTNRYGKRSVTEPPGRRLSSRWFRPQHSGDSGFLSLASFRVATKQEGCCRQAHIFCGGFSVFVPSLCFKL